MMKETGRNKLLTEGSIILPLARLAMPMLVGAVLHNAQSLIDLFWVGCLGASAVAAIAISGTITMIIFPMLMGIGVGTVAIVARSAGAEQWEEANKATGQSLILGFVFGSIAALIGWFFSGSLFHLLGAAPDVFAMGRDYLRILLLGSFAVFMLFIGNAALRGAGDTRTPMFLMAIASVLNIVLDPIFIFGLGPMPGMGVKGAAWATILAQTVAASVSLFILFGGKARLHIRWKQWKPDLNLSWRILRIGIPGSGQMLSRSLMGAVIMRIVAGCGTAAVAAYGTGMRIHMIILMPSFAIGGAAATMVGQNLGAGKPFRAARAAWYASGLNVVFMALTVMAILAFPRELIRIFNSNPEVVQTGSRYLMTVSPFYVFAALAIILSRALNGAGDSLSPMIFTIISLWGLQVPLAILFSSFWKPATQGIWWAMAVALVVHTMLVTAWFITGKWKNKQV